MTIARISTMNEDGKLGVFNVNLVFGGVHSFGGCRIAPSYPAMDFSVCIFSVRPRGATSSFGRSSASSSPKSSSPWDPWDWYMNLRLYQSIKCRYLYAILLEHLGSSRSPPPRRVWPLISERSLSGTVDFCDVSWSIKHLVELERPKTRVFTPKKVAKLAKEGKSLHSRET